MVIGAFPVAKLGVLAIKQVSKPIANVIKAKAKQSPVFRNYVCMPPAQLYNWIEVKTKMWALNLGKPVAVPPLNEAMAIELGANLLGEFIIFAIGAGVLIFEYARQSSNETKKTEQAREEKARLTNTLAEMGFRLERQDAQIREMTRILAALESRSLFPWHKEVISEYQAFDPNNPDQSSAAHNRPYESVSLLSRALNFLNTEIFVDSRAAKQTTQTQEQQKHVKTETIAESQNLTKVDDDDDDNVLLTAIPPQRAAQPQ